jgi:mitogen-activated protein kinase binding protein 1
MTGFQNIQSMEKCQDELNLTKFVTCSSDRTIRFWHHIESSIAASKQSEITKCLSRNAYCKDMSRMIFILRNNDPSTSNFDHFKSKPLDRNEDGSLLQTQADEDSATLTEMIDSLRCIRISPDGSHIASGDQIGNIRIHDLEKNND